MIKGRFTLDWPFTTTSQETKFGTRPHLSCVASPASQRKARGNHAPCLPDRVLYFQSRLQWRYRCDSSPVNRKSSIVARSRTMVLHLVTWVEPIIHSCHRTSLKSTKRQLRKRSLGYISHSFEVISFAIRQYNFKSKGRIEVKGIKVKRSAYLAALPVMNVTGEGALQRKLQALEMN